MSELIEKRKKILVEALVEGNSKSLVCTTGRMNAYRFAYFQGLGASPKDNTFDPRIGSRGGHKCCGSRVYWRHKAKCKMAVKNAPDDYSDLKDI